MKEKKYNKLTAEEEAVLIHKGTEPPFKGFFTDYGEKGIYICKQCEAPLFRSEYKFHSGCGWPSFDSQIDGAIAEHPDPDGRRTEIVCANCGAHMGHVFRGEKFTGKDTRHCVNSISMKFIPESETETAVFAGGCFWGVQHYFRKLDGVYATRVGYTGGTKENPTYKEVCYSDTGHYEALEVLFDPKRVSFEELAKLFFEIHDPEQRNGQGPDIGEQYLSAVFCRNSKQKAVTEKLIAILRDKGLDVATEVLEASTFWEAEDYHQNYYAKKGSEPYCHFRTKRF
ncbi:bifunctional methionine sulfoxide reductase B/A protein [Spirochaeta isovalerica]|uniref:Peptide methionine sulfoxide reductase MsrA n=1 Tax=Spirochaeta isovalerica TaxID=150 RepID=A0A841R6U5_9SPIO|nr:bifunctional methionine sulfoxide reductase B/A protein [Spirochaeta isovalerica]MBB6480934.1 peptide methionine sulfoxide reductase msrA/msrB [Spirochaeta isovalerica]